MGIFAEEGDSSWMGMEWDTKVWSLLGTIFACWFSEALVVLDCISKWKHAFGHSQGSCKRGIHVITCDLLGRMYHMRACCRRRAFDCNTCMMFTCM
jgi:hypothetical protein